MHRINKTQLPSTNNTKPRPGHHRLACITTIKQYNDWSFVSMSSTHTRVFLWTYFYITKYDADNWKREAPRHKMLCIWRLGRFAFKFQHYNCYRNATLAAVLLCIYDNDKTGCDWILMLIRGVIYVFKWNIYTFTLRPTFGISRYTYIYYMCVFICHVMFG